MSNREEAERLAALPWTVVTYSELLTDGTRVYLAHVPILDGCMAQGNSEVEAWSDLHSEVLPDWFEHLLDYNLPLPPFPNQDAIETAGTA